MMMTVNLGFIAIHISHSPLVLTSMNAKLKKLLTFVGVIHIAEIKLVVSSAGAGSGTYLLPPFMDVLMLMSV